MAINQIQVQCLRMMSMMITNKHTNRTANIDYYAFCVPSVLSRVCTQHEWRLKRIPKEQPAAMQFSAINGGQKMHFTDGIARLEGKKRRLWPVVLT